MTRLSFDPAIASLLVQTEPQPFVFEQPTIRVSYADWMMEGMTILVEGREYLLTKDESTNEWLAVAKRVNPEEGD